jgi:hypothetical protein
MRLSRLNEWPEDEFDMDFGGLTGNEYQAGNEPLTTTLYDLTGDPFGYPNASDISGGQMLPLDYSNTYPTNTTVSQQNNIQGTFPGVINSLTSLISTFGNAYAKVSAANVQPTQNRVLSNGVRPLEPTAPKPTSFIEQNKGILIPAGIAALLYLLA